MSNDESAHIVAVAADQAHRLTKPCHSHIRLIAGLGVEGDAHLGKTVQHRSRVDKDPSQPNLRQVHLLHAELFDELSARGFNVVPGALGENVTTRGIALLNLDEGTVLALGDEATIRITGLRNPCLQIDRFQTGLMTATLDRAPDGSLVRKVGVMAVVLTGGVVRPGDAIRVLQMPEKPRPLGVV